MNRNAGTKARRPNVAVQAMLAPRRHWGMHGTIGRARVLRGMPVLVPSGSSGNDSFVELNDFILDLGNQVYNLHYFPCQYRLSPAFRAPWSVPQGFPDQDSTIEYKFLFLIRFTFSRNPSNAMSRCMEVDQDQNIILVIGCSRAPLRNSLFDINTGSRNHLWVEIFLSRSVSDLRRARDGLPGVRLRRVCYLAVSR